MRRILTLALIAGVLILTPLVVMANTITENFTVPIDLSTPTTTATTTLPATLIPSGLSLFNPEDGTLTGISIAVSGPATWNSVNAGPSLEAFIDTASTTLSPQSGVSFENFTNPGQITINLSASSGSATNFGLFTGTGGFNGDLLLLQGQGNDAGDTITAAPLAGTITYDYTPAAPSATPEPASLLLFGPRTDGRAPNNSLVIDSRLPTRTRII